MDKELSENIPFAQRYHLKKLLGWGAHGEVYHAQDLHYKDDVAVKIFFSHREDVLRFVHKELHSISRLSHPNLLPFREFGESEWKGESVHYIITPFMEGGNLASVLHKKGALEIPDAVQIAVQIICALSYMHKNQCLHRDVKPANILLDKAGNVVLADFSIATSPECPATGPLGTPEYSAPEQLSDANAQDPRMDVYGLGVTFYEMLTGINPFREIHRKQGQGAMLQSKYLDDRIAPASDLNSNVPHDLARIVEKMMASNPENRYQDMEETLKALSPFSPKIKDILSETASTFIETKVRSETTLSEGSIKKLLDCLSIFWLSFLYSIFLWIKKVFVWDKEKLEENIERWFAVAQDCRKQGQWKKALVFYGYICFLKQDPVRAWNHSGDIWVKWKKYHKALKFFNMAILCDPKYYSAYCHRGFAYSGIKNFSRSLKDYDVAIALEPEKPQAYFYRAEVYLKLTLKYMEEKNFKKASLSYQEMQQDLLTAKRLAKSALSELNQSQG